MKKFPFLMLLLVLGLASCKDQEEKDRDLILDYIAEKNLDAIEGASGLYYVVDSTGNGTFPAASDSVEVDYEGFLLDDSKFDSSLDRGMPAIFSLNQVIRGWQLGIPYFSEGGSGKLIIPSELAYGDRSPSADIPKNSVLVFDIWLYDVR